jgi:hypothetical protein
MYEAPKRYVAASASALALAILFMMIAIVTRSVATPEIADSSKIKIELHESQLR